MNVNLYKPNFKHLKKIKDDTRRWKDFLFSFVGETDITKKAPLQETT